MNTKPGSKDTTPNPDLAESASFTSPTEYSVKLKSGLKFANGHDLTSSDVTFTFDRQVEINDSADCPAQTAAQRAMLASWSRYDSAVQVSRSPGSLWAA